MAAQKEFEFARKRPIDGLQYVVGFIGKDIEAALVDFIDRQCWRHDLARRVQHYGYVYDYRARQVRADMYLGELPAPLAMLAERLVEESHFARLPDQVIVNEYVPGQGIAPHTDCVDCFGNTVASISLLSACEMDFLSSPTSRRDSLLLEPGSLLTLSGPARYEWQHAIRPRKSDMVDGVRIHRGRRLSLTFRTVNL